VATNESANEHQFIIVDDDQLIRDFAVHTIEYGTNRKVATFENGFQAWQFIQSQPENVDIVIADANIPDMDGLELLAEVKQAFPEKIFIITTSNPAFEKSANRLGADAFLSKPYDVNDLFAIVQTYIRNEARPRKAKIKALPNSHAHELEPET
jgi:YesN/AraC family two-component response regulator